MTVTTFALSAATVLLLASPVTGDASQGCRPGKSAVDSGLLVNGTFDSDVSGWTALPDSTATTMVWDPDDDAGNDCLPGSMQLGTGDGQNSHSQASQCVASSISGDYSFGFRTLLVNGYGASMSCYTFASSDCSGDPTATATTAGDGGNNVSWSAQDSDPQNPLVAPAGTDSIQCIVGFSQGLRPAGAKIVPTDYTPAGLVDDAFLSAGTTPVRLQSFGVD